MLSFFHINKPPEEFEFWKSLRPAFESAKQRRIGRTSISSAVRTDAKSGIVSTAKNHSSGGLFISRANDTTPDSGKVDDFEGNFEEPGPNGLQGSSSFKDFETKCTSSPNPVLKNRDCGLAYVQNQLAGSCRADENIPEWGGVEGQKLLPKGRFNKDQEFYNWLYLKIISSKPGEPDLLLFSHFEMDKKLNGTQI